MVSQDGVRRGRVIVTGPLAPVADELRRDLLDQGYALDTICDHVHLLADLSGWLSEKGLSGADLRSEAVEEFLHACRAAGRRPGLTARGFGPVLEYLRRCGISPPPGPVVAGTKLEVVLAGYRRHLKEERGLSDGTIKQYLRCARAFLVASVKAGVETTSSLSALSAGQVLGYVLEWTRLRQTCAQDMVTLPALRSFLRFLHAAGIVRDQLAGAVPAGRGRRGFGGLPRAARGEHIRAVLAVCDRDSAAGRRDYAIVLMMARLALRGGEVGRLQLADVAWRAGELTIHGKGGRVDVLPVPADVGEAMADYVLHARPRTASANVFVTMKAPFTALAASSITGVVSRACIRAGVPGFGPHRIRHATACDLLAAGASMEEIGQLLRHAQERTTAIYAKVDQAGLAELAVPCPQGAAR